MVARSVPAQNAGFCTSGKLAIYLLGRDSREGVTVTCVRDGSMPVAVFAQRVYPTTDRRRAIPAFRRFSFLEFLSAVLMTRLARERIGERRVAQIGIVAQASQEAQQVLPFLCG